MEIDSENGTSAGIATEDGTSAGIATEHGMDSAVNATENGMDLGTLLNNSRNRSKLEIQVEFNNGMWWEIPPKLSQPLLRLYSDDYARASYVWVWEGTRPGSYCINGQPTKLNRYMIHFDTMKQVNMDNNSTRKLQIVRKVRSS